jgi:hypothetical protein
LSGPPRSAPNKRASGYGMIETSVPIGV